MNGQLVRLHFTLQKMSRLTIAIVKLIVLLWNDSILKKWNSTLNHV